MLARAAALIALLLLGGAAWNYLGGNHLREQVGAAPSGLLPFSADPREEPASVPTESRASESPPGLALGQPDVRSAVEIAGLVRVHLALESEQARDFAGWSVELGTRGSREDPLEVLEASAEAGGLAVFRITHDAEVLWARCVPPESSSLAMAAMDLHRHVDPEEPIDLELRFQGGGHLWGVVVDREGRGVEGARVHAFDHGSHFGIEDWQPSPVVAVSDAAGRVRFPRLRPSDWSIAVEPGDWLQLDPVLPDDLPGRSVFRVEEGSLDDSVRLEVVRAAPFDVHVVDVTGLPVEGATVRLEPLFLLGGTMSPWDPDDLDRLEAPLSGDLSRWASPPWPVFPYGELQWCTSRAGRARVLGIAGTWRLTVHGPLAGTSESGRPISLEVELPGPDRTIRFETDFLTCRALLEDERGRPVRGRTVQVLQRGFDHTLSKVFSDGHGRFEARWLNSDIEYDFRIEGLGFVDVRVPVERTPPGAPEQRIVLRDATRPRVRFLDPSGSPLPSLRVSVLEVRPVALRAGESLQLEGLDTSTELRTDFEGRLNLPGMPQGDFDLALTGAFAVGGVDERGYAVRVDPRGRPVIETRVLRTWTLPVTNDEQVLVIEDPPGAEPLAPPLPHHAGCVRNARSGAPVGGATLIVISPEVTRYSSSDPQGQFEVSGLPGSYVLVALANGYEILQLDPREWSAARHEHDIALEPGGGEVEIVFLDRLGAGLPTVSVTVRDAYGRVLHAPVLSAEGGFVLDTPQVVARGRATFLGLPRGELTFELTSDTIPLGTCALNVLGGLGPRRAELRLERSLEELRTDALRPQGIERD